MAPYPTELRVRVVAAVEEGGLSIPAAARVFQVGLTFIKKMLRLHRAGASLEPRHGGGPVPLLQEQEMTLLRQELKACPDATLAELQQALADKCHATASLSTISRGLQVLNLPRKKKVSSPVNGTKRPANDFAPSPLVFRVSTSSLLMRWAAIWV
jgi:transposase